MTFLLRKAGLLGLVAAATLAGCNKDKGVTSLEGPVPTPTFSATVDNSQYPVRVTFKNLTTDAFLYQWDFGDGSKLESGANPTHVYKAPGTYQVRLTAAGRGGTGIGPTQAVVVPSICGNAAYAVLTACAGTGATSWIFSTSAGAIQRVSATGTVLSSSAAPLPACQADDQFSFANNFTYSYDAGQQTYQNGTCGTALTGNADFVFKPNGNLGQIILTTNKAFIGLPDSVVNKTYDILVASATQLKLQGTNSDGTKTITTYVPQLSALDRAKALLTGGSSRTWVLDNTVAATIAVGNEASPTSYYPGGALGSLPTCQADDEYTFTNAGSFIYDAKAETFVAGAYSCQAPRSLTTTFTFGPASGSGLAQFTLNQTGAFIGVTDAPASRVYRILSIDNSTMLLRAGTPTDDPVFTIKMRVK